MMFLQHEANLNTCPTMFHPDIHVHMFIMYVRTATGGILYL